MDSRVDLQYLNYSSTLKVKTLKMIAAASLKTRFYENYYRRQPFSFPDSLMHYISKNPTSRKLYKKMVKSCKHFFVKNPALLIHNLSYCKQKWKNLVGEESFTLDLDNIGCKLWIIESVNMDIFPEINLQGLLSLIAPKIYRCDAENFSVANQAFSYEDYCVFSTCAKKISFYNVTVNNADGSITSLEKLIEAAPKLENAFFSSDDGTILSNITSNTAQELVKLPNFSKLKHFRLECIPETFNVEAFYEYMKANNFTTFQFIFADTLSDAYKKRVEKVIDKILEAEEIDFKPPFIDFVGINPDKYEKLSEIHDP